MRPFSREKPTRISSPRQGTLLILLSAAGFGSNTILAKFAYAGGANVPTMLFVRFFAASALLWLGMVLTGRIGLRLSGRALGGCLGLGAVMYAAQSLTFFNALWFISASLVALLHYIYPAVVTLLAAALLRERLDRWKVLALGMAGVGVLLVLGRGVGQAPSAGVTLALLSAGVYSGYIIISRQILRDVPPLAASAVIIPSASVSFGLYGVLSGQLRFGMDSGAYLAVTGMAICTVLAIITFFAGLRRVGASRAAILSTFEPVVTLTLGAALLADRLTAVQIIGGACILGAVLLLHGAPPPSDSDR